MHAKGTKARPAIAPSRPPPPLAPSAPPLSPTWGDQIASTVDVYALPVARLVPPSPPPPPPLRHHARRRPPTAGDSSQLSVHARSESDCCPSVYGALWFASHVAVYHVANASVGLIGFLLVTIGLACSLALLPLCGFGLVVLSATLRTTYHLSWFDAKMHNTIPLLAAELIAFPDDAERRPLLPLHDPRRHRDAAETTTGIALERPQFDDDALSRLSSRALLLLVYFGVVKPVLGLLSALGMTLFVAFVFGVVSDQFHVAIDLDTPTKLTIDSDEWSYVGRAAGALLAGVGLHIVARVALAATRFFSCERR